MANCLFATRYFNLPNYLCFTANTAGSTITLGKIGSPSWTGSYSTDGLVWITYIPKTTGAITLTNVGDKVYFKGTYAAANDPSNYLEFSMTGSIAGSGNIMSLCSGDSFESVTVIPYDCMFFALFFGCTSLTSAPDLPATTLTYACYATMFSGCTTLSTPPTISAATLVKWCCFGMFYGCSSLTTAPDLPATTCAEGCYQAMFERCSSLTSASALPATTLAKSCYTSMFSGCTSLTTAPALPATTLAESCYASMFYGCSSLGVYSSSRTGYTHKWRLPTSGSLTRASSDTYCMFWGTIGDYTSSDPSTTATVLTFYTQNEPI